MVVVTLWRCKNTPSVGLDSCFFHCRHEDVSSFTASSVSISISRTAHTVRGDLPARCVRSDAVDLKHVYLNLGALKILRPDVFVCLQISAFTLKPNEHKVEQISPVGIYNQGTGNFQTAEQLWRNVIALQRVPGCIPLAELTIAVLFVSLFVCFCPLLHCGSPVNQMTSAF